MKRFIFIMFSLLLFSSVQAAENYIMLTDFPVKKVVVRDDDVLSAASVYTIDNEKRQTILTPKVENGETILFLLLKDKEDKIGVKIENGVLKLDKKRGVKLFELDLPEGGEQ